MSFENLGLSPALRQAVADAGYTDPTPIQTQAIPAIIKGSDVLAAARTGTGKTAAFTLPLLERLGNQPERRPRVLILTPTRELAAQVAASVETYGGGTKLRTAVIYGGVGYQPQIARLKKGVDLIVATPGRLLDHLENNNADLSNVETLVLDEADRMLDMGFIHSIRKIQTYLGVVRQRLMFSATFSKDIRKLAGQILKTPLEIDIAPRNSTADGIDQQILMVDKTRKRAVLSHLIHDHQWPQVLIFTRTKHGANRLAKQLSADGIPADALHGNKSQNARTRALASFKSLRSQALVATDIAARGIDIDSLPHVVNFDIPNVPEDYVHRIGRTGRAGVEGQALSLVGPDERKNLKAIEKLIGEAIERMAPPPVDLRDDSKKHGPQDDDCNASSRHSKAGSTQRHRSPKKTGARRPIDKANAPHAKRRRNNKSGKPRSRGHHTSNQGTR